MSSKRHTLSIETDNLLLYGSIEMRAKEKVNEVWDKFEKRLSNETKKVFKPLPNIEHWKNFISLLITKQVYSMAEYDKIYNYNKKKNELTYENEVLDNLFWVSFYLPNILTAIIYKDKEQLKQLNEEIELSYKYASNELGIANNKLKIRAKKGVHGKNSTIRYTDLLRENTFENQLRRIADITRKKNGKLNFSKIASKIDGNICHHTIKKWCRKFKIPLESPYLTN